MQDLLSLLVDYPIVSYLGALVLGLLVGSFLNVVIYRLPKMMEAQWHEQCTELLCANTSTAEDALTIKAAEPAVFNLWLPRSRCPNCNHQITALENIPVLSYLFLRGKCSACKTKISLRYPAIELLTGLLSLFVIMTFGATTLGLMALIFTWCLIALTMIDYDTHLLPDDITLPLLWLGLIINAFGVITSLPSALWGAVGGYLFLWSIYWLFKLLTKKEGMGYGDFKLLAALGAWMGWQYLLQIILVSTVVGAVIGIALMIVKRRGKDIPIPFGPYLAIAGWIALIWGEQINQQYLKLFVVPY